MSAAVASIRARFGQHVIGLGYLGIRYVLVRLKSTSAGRSHSSFPVRMDGREEAMNDSSNAVGRTIFRET
jgi:hypothetical protein